MFNLPKVKFLIPHNGDVPQGQTTMAGMEKGNYFDLEHLQFKGTRKVVRRSKDGSKAVVKRKIEGQLLEKICMTSQ